MDGDETLARELLASTRDGVAVFGPSGRLVMWNAAAQAITGWTRAEAANHDLTAIPRGLSEIRDGKWIDTRRITFHLGEDQHHALLFADTTAQLELAESNRKLRDIGLVEPATGLPGRALALDHLTRSLALADRDSRAVGVLVIGCRPPDGAGSGTVVDVALARQIARRLTISTRSSDFVAHTEQWTFVVILTAMSVAADSVMVVTARLLLALAQPIVAGTRERSITTAIGVTRGPVVGVSANDLLVYGEAAMRDARADGAPYRLVAADGRERDPEVVVGEDLLV